MNTMLLQFNFKEVFGMGITSDALYYIKNMSQKDEKS